MQRYPRSFLAMLAISAAGCFAAVWLLRGCGGEAVEEPPPARTSRDLAADLRAVEQELGAGRPDLQPLLRKAAESHPTGVRADAVSLLQQARHLAEGEEKRTVLELLATAYGSKGDFAASEAVWTELVRESEGRGDEVALARDLVKLATAHVYANHQDRAQPLVPRARQLVAECVDRGECLGDEILADVTRLDLLRIERALEENESGRARGLMRDILARGRRDSGDPCEGLVEVLVARLDKLRRRCEASVRAGALERADRDYRRIVGVLALASHASDCTDLTDATLVADVTLVLLRADLEAGHTERARQRMEGLIRDARAYFERGELRDLIRYDVTELVLELASTAASEQRLDAAHRLQRFLLQLYTAANLIDTPALCELARSMSDLDLNALKSHLATDDAKGTEELVTRLRRRYGDPHIRRCVPHTLADVAVVLADHARTAIERLQRRDGEILLALARSACRENRCQQSLRELERQIQQMRWPASTSPQGR